MEYEFLVYIKNVGVADITLPEIGGYVLTPGSEINLLDESLPSGHYNDPQTPIRALTELTGTVLYQQRVAGNLTYRIEPGF
jgi:hypothetical protein